MIINSWQRLEAVIRWSGMSTHAFAGELGLRRSENLYQIKRGNNGISRYLANLITSKYPIISKLWLLTGDGEMFVTPKSRTEMLESKGIPYYDVDILNLISNMDKHTPSFNINIPIFRECDFAIKVNGNAMAPLIPAGAIVLIKKISPDFILFGENHLVVTDNFCAIREIRKHESSDNEIRLIAANKDKFDDIEIDKSRINAIFIIHGIIHTIA